MQPLLQVNSYNIDVKDSDLQWLLAGILIYSMILHGENIKNKQKVDIASSVHDSVIGSHDGPRGHCTIQLHFHQSCGGDR